MKNLLDLEKFPIPEDILKIDNSECVKNSSDCLRHITSTGEEPRKNVFTCIRDYLLSTILMDNCSRPGGVYNMTLLELNKAYQDGNTVIQVFEHKTSSKGPVDIAVSNKLYSQLQNYVKHVRNLLPGISANHYDPVFISYSGSKMSASLVGKQFVVYFLQYLLKGSSPQSSLIPELSGIDFLNVFF